MNVDLQRSVQFGGYAEGDVLIDIEDIAGSLEDDIIRGDSGANRLDGNSGDDTLEGRGGDDILAGDFNGLTQVHFQFLPDGNVGAGLALTNNDFVVF